MLAVSRQKNISDIGNGSDNILKQPLLAEVSTSNLQSNFFTASLRALAAKDASPGNAILQTQHIRELVELLVNASLAGNLGSLDNRFNVTKKFDEWVVSEPSRLNALIKWWEDGQNKGMFDKLSYTSQKFLMEGVNAFLLIFKTSDSKLTAFQVVRTLKTLLENPQSIQYAANSLAIDIAAEQSVQNNFSVDVQEILAPLQALSRFLLNGQKKSRTEIIEKMGKCFQNLQDKIPSRFQDITKLFIRDIIAISATLANNLNLPSNEQDKLIDNYLFASCQFTEYLFTHLQISDEERNRLLMTISLTIANAVFMASYNPKNCREKLSLLAWKLIAPISAFFSKGSGIGGASAAQIRLFAFLASVKDLPIVGDGLHLVLSSLPFAAGEIIGIYVYVKFASYLYEAAADSIASKAADTTQRLQIATMVPFLQEPNLSSASANNNQKKVSSSTNIPRTAIARARNFPADFRDRLLFIADTESELDATQESWAQWRSRIWHCKPSAVDTKKNKADWIELEVLSLIEENKLNFSSYPWLELIQNISNKKFANPKDFAARAQSITTDFFDKIIEGNPQVHKEICRMIALSDELFNHSDGISIADYERIYKKIVALAKNISDSVISSPDQNLSDEEKNNLQIYLQYHLVYFAAVLSDNPRALGNKLLRNSAFAIMPAINFGVMKYESDKIVEYVQDPEKGAFSISNLGPEMAVGIVAGAFTIWLGLKFSLFLREKAQKRDNSFTP